MEDFYKAGGVPTLLHELRPLLHLDAMTVTGKTLGAELDVYTPPFLQDIVRPLSDPLAPNSSLVVLQGNIAPSGCVLKQSAMAPALKHHRGPAIVFKNSDDMLARIDDPDLRVTADSVCVAECVVYTLTID